MSPRVGLASVLLYVAACSPPDPPRAQDHHAIIAAVLHAERDWAAEWRDYVRDYPEENTFLAGLFDHRLCVESTTAGSPSDFQSSTMMPYRPDAPSDPPEWDRSRRSYPIAPEQFPRHLRRAWFFSICPSGTLRLSNPRFEGQTARLFWEHHCGGLCGGGGEIILRKVRGRWEVQEKIGYWQS